MTKTEPFDITRRVLAMECVDGWQNAAMTSSQYDPDVTELLATFAERNSAHGAAGHVGLNALWVKLIAEALQASPRLNAQVRYRHLTTAGSIKISPVVNVTMPFLSRDGRTLVPMFPDVAPLSIRAIQARMDDFRRREKNTNLDRLLRTGMRLFVLTELARHPVRSIVRLISLLLHPAKGAVPDVPAEDRLTLRDFVPGTVLITNPGSVYPGIRMHPSLFEIVPGTAAGFALGAVYDNLEMRDGAPCVRKRLPLTIVTDHKIADYADVARFIARVEELCADRDTVSRFW